MTDAATAPGGVIGIAAGTRLGLDDLLAPSSAAGGWLIAGGTALFLAGTALFRARLGFASPWPRVIGALLLLATAPIGIFVGTAQQLGAVAVLVALTIAAGPVRIATSVSRSGRSPSPG